MKDVITYRQYTTNSSERKSTRQALQETVIKVPQRGADEDSRTAVEGIFQGMDIVSLINQISYLSLQMAHVG